jgi:dipeptidyl aminopeptidase/acylaminoacyl peptidase
LFIMPAPTADGQAVDPATIRRLTAGDYDHTLPQWTPDSTEIGVLCNRDDDRDRATLLDLWAINRETANARCISDGTLETLCYSWSPDSRSVVLVAEQDMRIAGSTNAALYLFSRDGGQKQILTEGVDNAAYPSTLSSFGLPGPYRPQWSPDGQRVYFLLMDHGCVDVCRVDVEQKQTTILAKHESITYFQALLPNERGLILAQAGPHHPWELNLLPLSAIEVKEPVRLTHFYDQQLAEFMLSNQERIRYRGANNDEIDGWLIRPVGARDGVRYPLVVSIHGGPQWAFGVSMNLTHQYLAAQGFAVFFCNPHGSTGQGQAFMREVEGDWGGWDYQDIMLGVDECIARGVADPERLLVTGYSYGGYMSMFIIGQTGRFKAAVPMAGISNLASFVGTTPQISGFCPV